eukprot:TRINITY_DN7076_c0_g1_i2.p3 TRINITY_DN7076_c0_g1~~TRINITY_DN7076_c0_g1_i2.p3  ORF type:complete len:346 (+),score=132.12 TRINITY_DN7076_c0_g1_i2:1961-2998(+)
MADLCATYPEYASLRVLEKEWGLDETLEKLEDALKDDWWCVVRRSLPYSPGSASTVQEVYMLIRKPYGWENFVAEGSGKIVYRGRGRRKELVYNAQAHAARDVRKFVILDIPPVKAFYLRHNGQSFRAYRFSLELHFDKDTHNKLDVHQYLQDYSSEVHPTILPRYLVRLVEAVKEGHKGLGALHDTMLQEFKADIAGFKILQAREQEELRQMQIVKEAEEAAQRQQQQLLQPQPQPQQFPNPSFTLSEPTASARASTDNLVNVDFSSPHQPDPASHAHQDLMTHMLDRLAASEPPSPAAAPLPSQPTDAAPVPPSGDWVQFEPSETKSLERRKSAILDSFGPHA